MPRGAWTETLTGAGLGRTYAALLPGMYDGINEGRVRFEGAAAPRTGSGTLEAVVRSWSGQGNA